MGKLFAPATALMSRLKFPQRFALITLLFLLPLGYALWAFISTVNYQVNFSQKEVWGNAYMRPLNTLYRDVIEDWLLSQTALQGLHTADPTLQQNQAKIDQDFTTLGNVDAQYGLAFGTTSKFAVLKNNWDEMKVLSQNAERQLKYASLVSGVRGLISTVGDQSNLILDPDLDSYYTMDATLIQLPAMQNTLLDLAVQVDGVLMRRQITAAERAQLTILEGQILKLDDNLTNGSEVAFANNPFGNLRPAIESSRTASRSALNDYLTKLDLNVLQAPSIALSPDSWLESARAALQASYNLWDVQVGQLDVLLNNRVAAYENNRTLALAVSLVALFVVVYMWIGFYRAVMLSVSQLEQTANMLASGNTVAALKMGGRDEMSQRAAAAMNKMADATNQMNSAIEQRTNELTEVSYLLAYMHDGVVITDDNGSIKVLNGTATRMLNTQYDAAVGQPLLGYVRDTRLQETMRAALAAPTQRFAVDVPINNRLISVTVTFVPVEGNTTGLLVMQDVTELRTLQQQQQFAKATNTTIIR